MGEECNHLPHRHVAIGIPALVFVAGKTGLPVWREKPERVPSLAAPRIRNLAALEHRTDRLSVTSHLWGPVGLIGELASLQRTDTPERLDRYVARIAATPAFYAASVDVMREAEADGVVSPRIVVERAIAQAERVLGSAAEDSPALAPLAPDDAAARERVAATVSEHFLPALEGYLEALRDHLPKATTLSLAEAVGY